MIDKTMKTALCAGSALGVMLSMAAMAAPAFAQDKAKADANEVEELVVVGSRIRRDTFNSPSPVQVITREESTLAGFASTTEALQGTAVTGGSAQINNAFGGYVTNGGPGANTLSLRGLGASRTLILLNGRRVAPAGSRGSVGSADLNVLPSAMIDRVEILKDGASSIYGSDAVAGVVNIITKQNAQGITVENQYNKTAHGGGNTNRLSVVAGATGDRWTLSGSLEYLERSDLTLADRDWTRCNTDSFINRASGGSLDFVDPLTKSPKCYPITTTGSNGVTINTLGTTSTTGVGAAGSVGTTFNRWRPNSAVTTGLVGWEGVGGGSNNLNVRDTFDPRTLKRSLISPVKIYTAFGQGAYDLQALGNAEVYFEVLANQRRSQQTGYRQLSLDYAKGSPLIPSNLAFSTFLAAGGSTMTKGLATGVRAFIGFGNDVSSQVVKFEKATGGIRGDLTFLPNWRYDFSASYSNSDSTYTQQSWLTDRLAESMDVVVAPTGTPAQFVRNGYTCRVNTTNSAAGCIPGPALTSDTVGGKLPQDWIDYTFQKVTGKTNYNEAVATVNFDGPVFKLPAGEVKASVGAEIRRNEIDDTPDINSQTGNLYNLTSSTITRGDDQVWEVFGEVEIPLLANQPFAKDLTLNLSGRHTDYKSYGSDQTYKVGGVYTPVGWLSFRGTYGTSFRAPALFEQYQGATSGFLSNTIDPCDNYGAQDITSQRYKNCNAELNNTAYTSTQSVKVLTAGGADQGLEAETSKNYTGGIILQPELPSGWGSLSVAIDYYNIKINNGVARFGASNILQACYDDPQFRSGGGFCRFVDTRAVGTNALTVHDSYTNIAIQVVKGWDYNFRYKRDIGEGRLTLNAQVTQYLSQASKLFSDDEMDEYNGTVNSPEYTGTFDATYAWKSYKFRYGLEWIAAQESYAYLGVNKQTTQYDFDVPDYFLHSLSVQYTSKNEWEATFGVRNLMDKDPPVISSGYYNRVGNAPLYSGYDYIGRQFFLNVSKSF